MAQYTTNYNLYMPDSTDPVGDFRAEFNNNMNIIDNNMGGGGGGSSTLAGLTDVSLSSPTNGQVLTYDSVAQKWKNTNGGGGGGGDTYNVYGAFIDTANVIVAQTSYHGNASYTATEDCFVSYEVACPANDNAYVKIDGVAVCEFYFPMVCFASDNIPLKAGQTISFTNAYSSYLSYYTVYGITQGVNQVGEHYSTNEEVIGTWTDGKPLYRQTITFNTGNVASNIDFDISSYMPANCVVRFASFILEFNFSGDNYHGVDWGGAYIGINGSHYLSFTIGSAVYDKHVELTIEYTKTTD